VCVYGIFFVVATLNYFRQLGAYRYLNEGEQMTYREQMLDSTTIATNPISGELWAPLGMRYHALHHLLPSLPYHAMGTAHRRLMHRLPEDSPYRLTIRASLWAAVVDVVRNAGGAKSGTGR
jgi:fatty acid desaturase